MYFSCRSTCSLLGSVVSVSSCKSRLRCWAHMTCIRWGIFHIFEDRSLRLFWNHLDTDCKCRRLPEWRSFGNFYTWSPTNCQNSHHMSRYICLSTTKRCSMPRPNFEMKNLEKTIWTNWLYQYFQSQNLLKIFGLEECLSKEIHWGHWVKLK